MTYEEHLEPHENAYHLTIHVTQADIDKGIRYSASKNPVALAVDRYFMARARAWDVFVVGTHAVVNTGWWVWDAMHDAATRNFIVDFSDGKAVNPFTATLFFQPDNTVEYTTPPQKGTNHE